MKPWALALWPSNTSAPSLCSSAPTVHPFKLLLLSRGCVPQSYLAAYVLVSPALWILFMLIPTCPQSGLCHDIFMLTTNLPMG